MSGPCLRYSVVIAVYINDRPDWLKQALDSILDQSVKSDDIVVVCDGQITGEMEVLLREYTKKYETVSVVRLDKNVGAGQARNEGVKYVKNELIAVMDADDISMPNRFELLLAEFTGNPELVLVGGQISEFEGAPENIIGYRKVPLELDAMKRFARYRSPINHVTILFQKTAFLEAGGYPAMTRAEDYCMVSSLLAKNYKVSNIPAIVVNCRVNEDNILRRKTWKNIRENIASRWIIHRFGTVSLVDFCISSLAQIFLFIMPVRLAKKFFNNILRTKYE